MGSREPSVAVIGGGVSGITTAVLLQVNGHDTTLYTSRRGDYRDPAAPRPPELASLHAAASVIPHSVSSPHTLRWTRVSQAFFGLLAFRADCGVRSQTHYELFEDDHVQAPDYAPVLANLELLSGPQLAGRWVPRRPGAGALSGWRFDVFFCESNRYLPYLYRLFEAMGGRICDAGALPGRARLADYLALGCRVLVNCTGYGARELLAAVELRGAFSDDPGPPGFVPLADAAEPLLVRGHYLLVELERVFTGEGGRPFSYNYTPEASVYHGAGGGATDVYCYPRSDAWVLGGSRDVQHGPLGRSGAWRGEETPHDVELFARSGGGSLAVPAPILRLNHELLMRLTGGELDLLGLRKRSPAAFAANVGYRFQRAGAHGGVRLDCSRVRAGGERFVVHNYGHGGAGVTLSWGCALDVLRIVNELADPPSGPSERDGGALARGDASARSMLLELSRRLTDGCRAGWPGIAGESAGR